MKARIIFILFLGFGVALAVAFLLPAVGSRVQAQSACMEFRAVGQAILPTPHPLKPDDVWGGDAYGTLGGQFITGIFSGNDGIGNEHGVPGMGRDGLYTFVFGTDSFTMVVHHATWPFPPGKVGLGYYRGTAKIMQGTGRFQNASGNLDWAGPFIVWTPDEVNYYGRYNAEIRGSICGVE